ncbi:hypothetical protein HN682_06575 [Candidatus Peregrinibacteria bacterium]|jgi:hypothetical protein|nr:hypothetical protein [Candidatus Peregrinibacteria bacterium]
MLFKRKRKVFTEPNLTSSKAMAIYELLKTFSPQDVRLKHGHRMVHIQRVLKESKRLEAEVRLKLSGNYLITPAVFEGDDLIEPAVYYTPATQPNMKNSLSSDLLNVTTVVDDIRSWSNGDPVNPPTWNAFKNSFDG